MKHLMIIAAGYLLLIASSQALPLNDDKVTPKQPTETTITGSFSDRVNQGILMVHKQDPDAKFLEADVQLSSPASSATDVNISEIRLFFEGHDGYAIFLKCDASQCAPPEATHDRFVGDYVLKWPVQISLSDAINIKNAAGYTKPFEVFTLRTPLSYPSDMHPLYIFRNPDGSFVFVDTVTEQAYSSQTQK